MSALFPLTSIHNAHVVLVPIVLHLPCEVNPPQEQAQDEQKYEPRACSDGNRRSIWMEGCGSPWSSSGSRSPRENRQDKSHEKTSAVFVLRSGRPKLKYSKPNSFILAGLSIFRASITRGRAISR